MSGKYNGKHLAKFIRPEEYDTIFPQAGSYTHLDVYKRQVPDCSHRAWQPDRHQSGPAARPKNNNWHASDVYKRQL